MLSQNTIQNLEQTSHWQIPGRYFWLCRIYWLSFNSENIERAKHTKERQFPFYFAGKVSDILSHHSIFTGKWIRLQAGKFEISYCNLTLSLAKLHSAQKWVNWENQIKAHKTACSPREEHFSKSTTEHLSQKIELLHDKAGETTLEILGWEPLLFGEDIICNNKYVQTSTDQVG